MAAPPMNRNRTRHGLCAGRLPKGAAYVKRTCDGLRRAIEAEVLARHGELSLHHAALIQSAIRWERHALLVQRWLRLDCDRMDMATRLAYSRDIARASAERVKCLTALRLDRDRSRDILATLYAPHREPETTDEPTAEAAAAQTPAVRQPEGLEAGEKMAPSTDNPTRKRAPSA